MAYQSIFPAEEQKQQNNGYVSIFGNKKTVAPIQPQIPKPIEPDMGAFSGPLTHPLANKKVEPISFAPSYTSPEIKTSTPAILKPTTGTPTFSDVVSEIPSAYKKITAPFIPNQEELKAEYEASKPTHGTALSNKYGLISKDPISGKYGAVDVLGAVGSIEDVAKTGINKMANEFAEGVKNTKLFNPFEYVAEQTAKQDAARTAGSPSLMGKIGGFFNDIKSKLIDSNATIEDLLSKSLKENNIDLKPTEHITNQIDRTYKAPTIAGQFAKDNGIVDIIKNVDNVNNLDQYMIAKQAKDVEAQGFKTGRDLSKDEQLVEHFKDQYEPVAQKVNEYSQKLLDYSVDSGLIGKETADILKKKYPNYVPINRIFSELEQGGEFGTKAVASLSSQSVVKGLQGSEREIESPLASLLAKTNDAFVQGEKNKTARMLAGYEKLPRNPFQLREIKGAEKVGNKSTISFLDNGVKRTFETTKEVSDAAKSLDVQQLNILGQIFAAPVRLARVGITGINLPFVASNIAKDQITGIINSSKPLRTSIANPLNFMKALYNAVGHGELYEEMVRAGGGGTSFDMARNQAKQTIEQIRSNRNIGSKILYTIKNPSELLRSVEDIVARSEELTRIQQYTGTKDALLKEGMSEEDAMAGAARAARENTVNFARRGEWGKVLNSAFLYLNAGIQGSRTFVRNLTEKPVQTATKLGLTVFAPQTIATMWNLSDPERKAAYEDIADYEKENNIIIVPPHPAKDENGKWNIIKIPLSQEINNIASIPRRLVEQSYGLDPLKTSEVAKALIGSVSPVTPDKGSVASTLTPQAIKPELEAYTNTNFFTGMPQVPASMEKLPPELQAKQNTAGTARVIGEKTGLSPIKVEEFIKGVVGGVGSQVLHFTDMSLAGLDIIPKEQVHGQKILEAITARFNKATGGSADDKQVNDLTKELETQAGERFKISQEAEVLYKELKALPKEQANIKAEELSNKNPELYTALEKVATDEKKGMTYSDRLLGQLGVVNGKRARVIWTTLKGFTTKEEKNNYINELQDKGLVSDTVFEQLVELKQHESQ